jgi:hypothetical protein
MVSLLGFADIIGIERAAFARLRPAQGSARSTAACTCALPMQDNRNVAEKSHFLLYN